MKELGKLINDPTFITNYNALKENIINVNPIFVIGTLRLFSFEKWSKLNDDGSKTVKVESFTRWWNRMGNKLNVDSKNTSTNTGFVKPPNPPQNLELFLKLLVLLYL